MTIEWDYKAPRNDEAKVRAALADRLLREGVQVGDTFVPIELIDGTGSAFVVLGRVIVQRDQADRVRQLCRVRNDVTEIEGTDLVIVDTNGPTLDVLARLNGEGINATPDHVMMSAGRIIIKEGEDPENADAPEFERRGKASEGARVVVIDTGLDPAALGSPWFNGVTVDSPHKDPLFSASPTLGHGGGHGTFVAGIVRQIAPDCELTVLKALDVHGVGLESEIARGLLAARRYKPQFVLCAFGGYTAHDVAPAAIEAAVAQLTKMGCVVVAAGGNEREFERSLWPASLADVHAIAAVESKPDGSLILNDAGMALLTQFTNTGPTIVYGAAGRWRSVFATGNEDPRFETDGTPESFDGAARIAGTSMAAAAVVGALAALAGAAGDPYDAWRQLVNAPIPIAGSKLHAIDVWTATGG